MIHVLEWVSSTYPTAILLHACKTVLNHDASHGVMSMNRLMDQQPAVHMSRRQVLLMCLEKMLGKRRSNVCHVCSRIHDKPPTIFACIHVHMSYSFIDKAFTIKSSI